MGVSPMFHTNIWTTSKKSVAEKSLQKSSQTRGISRRSRQQVLAVHLFEDKAPDIKQCFFYASSPAHKSHPISTAKYCNGCPCNGRRHYRNYNFGVYLGTAQTCSSHNFFTRFVFYFFRKVTRNSWVVLFSRKYRFQIKKNAEDLLQKRDDVG